MNNDDDVKYDEYCSRCLTIFNTDNNNDDDNVDNNNDDDVKYDEYCSRCSTVVRAFS